MHTSRVIRTALRNAIRNHPDGKLMLRKPISNMTKQELYEEVSMLKISACDLVNELDKVS